MGVVVVYRPKSEVRSSARSGSSAEPRCEAFHIHPRLDRASPSSGRDPRPAGPAVSDLVWAAALSRGRRASGPGRRARAGARLPPACRCSRVRHPSGCGSGETVWRRAPPRRRRSAAAVPWIRIQRPPDLRSLGPFLTSTLAPTRAYSSSEPRASALGSGSRHFPVTHGAGTPDTTIPSSRLLNMRPNHEGPSVTDSAIEATGAERSLSLTDILAEAERRLLVEQACLTPPEILALQALSDERLRDPSHLAH